MLLAQYFFIIPVIGGDAQAEDSAKSIIAMVDNTVWRGGSSRTGTISESISKDFSWRAERMDNDDEVIYLKEDKSSDHKRREERLSYVFDIKFCPVKDEKKWDVVNIRNLSKKGIMFYATDYYPKGDLLRVLIINPFSAMNVISTTRVMRSNPTAVAGGLYETVIDVTMLDEKIKEVLYRTIDHILENRRNFF